MHADGSAQTNLTRHADDDFLPTWSPDGTRIAFTSRRDGNDEIYVMNPDGSGQTRLTTDAAIDAAPTWSPDGQRLAFQSNRGDNPQNFEEWAREARQPRPATSAARDANSNPRWWAPPLTPPRARLIRPDLWYNESQHVNHKWGRVQAGAGRG